MDQENGKVEDVEVSENHTPAPRLALDNLAPVKHGNRTRSPAASAQDLVASNAGRERVRPALKPVTGIVDVTSDAPPSRGNESRSSLGLEVGKVLNAGILRIPAEVVLLRVGQAEDAITSSQDGTNSNQAESAKLLRMDGKVACLSRVHERQPNDISEAQHEPEAVSSDIHGSQDRWFHVNAVQNVDSLDGGDEEDRIGNIAVQTVLLGDEGAVENDPPQETGAHFHEFLDVHFADEGQSDAWIELATNIEIVDEGAGGTACCQLAHVLVAGLDVKAADVDEDGERGSDEDVGADDLRKVVGDESPNRELGALSNGAGSQDGQGAHGRVESVQLVLEPTAGAQLGSLDVVAGEDAVLNEREGVVTQSPERGGPREEPEDAIFRPANFALELGKVEGLGVEERGRRAAGDVVAEKVEDVDENGEAKCYDEGADAVVKLVS